MSLRTRLLVAVGVIALVALTVADVVTYRALEAFLVQRVDQQLTALSGPVEHGIEQGQTLTCVGRLGPSHGDLGQGLHPEPGGGDGPPSNAFQSAAVQVRTPSGTVVSGFDCPATVGQGTYSPAVPAERLNGDDGLGGIYPAIANSVMMFRTLGYPDDHPAAATAWAAVRKLLVHEPDRAWCQPCLSPVWDTGLAGHAMAETGEATDAACDWLLGKQILDVKGDWTVRRPDLRPGGWAFQYENAHYPDVDDTAVVGMLLHRNGDPKHEAAIARAREWIIGMQSSGGGKLDGGWGAFEPENTHLYLNHIPFADHGALLDPPTSDVTARCVSFLAQIGMTADDPVMVRALAFLRREQEADGSWFGRWGTNYIYGTWSVLCALNAVGLGMEDPAVRRAVDWLASVQRDDGGWGEDEESYGAAPPGRYKESTPSQTAWAVLGLMAAGAVDHPAVARGIAYLSASQRADGEWTEHPYTAVGFPRVFYLRYHGYRLYFPLLALARYRNLTRGNTRQVSYGF